MSLGKNPPERTPPWVDYSKLVLATVLDPGIILLKLESQKSSSHIKEPWPVPDVRKNTLPLGKAAEDQEILSYLASFRLVIETARSDAVLPNHLVVQPHPVAVDEPLPLHVRTQPNCPSMGRGWLSTMSQWAIHGPMSSRSNSNGSLRCSQALWLVARPVGFLVLLPSVVDQLAPGDGTKWEKSTFK